MINEKIQNKIQKFDESYSSESIIRKYIDINSPTSNDCLKKEWILFLKKSIHQNEFNNNEKKIW